MVEITEDMLQTWRGYKTMGLSPEEITRLVDGWGVTTKDLADHEHHLSETHRLGWQPGRAFFDNRGGTWWHPGLDRQRWAFVKERLESNPNFEAESTESIIESSAQITGLLGNPADASFDAKGLAIGNVQSGKTTNFLSVISRAADAGYRIVIVLVGMTEMLREQTEDRCASTLGFDENPELWLPLTRGAEFEEPAQTLAQSVGNRDQALIAVVKKNPAPLGKLIHWLTGIEPPRFEKIPSNEDPTVRAEIERRNTAVFEDWKHKAILDSHKDLLGKLPVLIIDDEADQASINTGAMGTEEDRTRINAMIVKLTKFERTTYVAYTATPFANLLAPNVDGTHGSLYPKSFIISLPEPLAQSGYFGPRQLAGSPSAEDEPAAEIVVEVADSEAQRIDQGHRPESLEEAVLYFLVACAALVERGWTDPDEHRATMLIHTTRITDTHSTTLENVRTFLQELLDSNFYGDPAIRSRLREVWNDQSDRYDPEKRGPSNDFEQIEGHLPGVLEAVTREVDGDMNGVVEENSYSKRRLSSTDGQFTIVVGGNTLARGVTLPGLVCSYFVRSAGAADTLSQMGRWFGYRKGYADLPRLWTTEDLLQKFAHISRIETQVRDDLAVLNDTDTPIPPHEAAIRILSYQADAGFGATSRQKSAFAQLQKQSWAEKAHQTIYFDISPSEAGKSLAVSSEFLSSLLAAGVDPAPIADGSKLFRGVSHLDAMTFLKTYPHPREAQTLESGIDTYDSRVKAAGIDLTWNVVIMNSTGRPANRHGEPFAEVDFGDLGTFAPWSRPRSLETRESKGVVNISVVRNKREDEKADYPDLGTLGEARLQRDADRSALLVLYPIARNSTMEDSPPKSSDRDLKSPKDLVGFMVVVPSVAASDDIDFLRRPDGDLVD